MRKQGLKRWEMALALAVCITLSCASAAPAYWWGTIFPGLSECAGGRYTEAAGYTEGETGGVELRLRAAEWLRELWALLRSASSDGGASLRSAPRGR